MRTGTATYFGLLLKRIAGFGVDPERVSIITDVGMMENDAPLPETVEGFRVSDIADMAPVTPSGATRVFFLANNNFHSFALNALRREPPQSQGRRIAVLHDPSMFMIGRYMTAHGDHRIGQAELVRSMQAQYGKTAERLLASRLAGDMPDMFEFVTQCLDPVLAATDEIWVHSLYAATRIVCENEIPINAFPRIRVCAHPHPDPQTDAGDVDAPAPGTASGDKFRIGVFGWVTWPKRVTSVIRGLSLALDRLPHDFRDQVELVIVGRRPEDTVYDPAREAALQRVTDHVRFIDYPDADEFQALIGSSDLVFNLRYPSCGESSGTLAIAEGATTRTVISRYQAFREGRSPWRTATTIEPVEDWDIASAICSAFADWRGRQTPPVRQGVDAPGIAPAEKLLLAEFLTQRCAQDV